MAKYKVGDKVRVRSDLEKGVMYGFQTFTNTMVKHLGKTVTITEQHLSGYSILEDDGDWKWTDEMFDGLVEEVKTVHMPKEETKTVHMTTIEVLDWIKDNYYSDVYRNVFGVNYPITALLCDDILSASEIVSKIEEYERKKKEEEEKIETEIKFALRIIEDKKSSKVCVDEKMVDEYPSIGEISNYLKEYCLAHKGEGDFFCIIEKRCCVKNNKGGK